MPNSKIALVQRAAAVPWAAEVRGAGFDLQRFEDPSGLFGSRAPVALRLVVLSDWGGGTWAAIEAARKIRSCAPAVPIVLIATESCEESAIAALKAGIADYLKAPVSVEQILSAVNRLAGPSLAEPGRMVGQSASVRGLIGYAARVAVTNSTVLITGETGTGKDLAAEMIHSLSPRSARPFVALNCAAIPDSLLESELFGRERGAYTGADTAYEGKLKLADGGTVFFDEIGDLSAYGQAKLLRVLECRQVQRLGSAADIPLNIRILAATNQDLAGMVERGQFRRDLYYRLSVTRLELPPLRERREDVAALLAHFADGFSRGLGLPFPGFTAHALHALSEFHWPGNVRQLRNVVEELFVRLPDRPIDVHDLPSELAWHRQVREPEPADERTRIVSALAFTHWNKKRAAERLHWSRMTLYRKMALHQIAAPAGVSEEPASVGRAE